MRVRICGQNAVKMRFIASDSAKNAKARIHVDSGRSFSLITSVAQMAIIICKVRVRFLWKFAIASARPKPCPVTKQIQTDPLPINWNFLSVLCRSCYTPHDLVRCEPAELYQERISASQITPWRSVRTTLQAKCQISLAHERNCVAQAAI
jgi:hypothetical protein